ncbi:hypothetical protein BGL34_01185 [Fructilactobacillus lindneri]|uniref:Acyl carrier protein n=2 Tax=Fructilactobacillus lindneri TaxID=53444 RepID=A0A0R2JY77_9LACO|nr:acyl carrier protein [Fructilactobacillus lindneri]ANZ58213.1 hypothetical protein AYR60_05400 [Fructilactobacillus lindneri]ANZ59534.1 hypothetical protein AYR59_05655 [Fructilactobacillus lindneri]KRN79037.1 hypothetical protein IV52_GL000442 [Fructilactobacillus lindneri DSM 20690 = JCM 11027]POG98682.1 hypothetical protein BGL31_01775 [Fructilactobacillus lindneri]POH04070.1 hypothetical protein BGL32_01715 [Fructilactobacillus lindneri]
MDDKKVFLSVVQTVCNQFNVDAALVSPKTDFNKDLGADFVDLAKFIVEIEDEFGDVIPNDAAERIQTVNDLVNVIVESTNKKRKK